MVYCLKKKRGTFHAGRRCMLSVEYILSGMKSGIKVQEVA